MENTQPLVSVIMPTYNHAAYIGKAIESVLHQTYENFELIVVNNFSEDNTVEIVQGFHDDRVRLVNFANNGVIAASRNRGLHESRGEWIAFLDSDDFWYREKLETCSMFFRKYDLIYHVLDIYTDTGRRGKVTTRRLKQPVMVDLLTRGNPIANSSVCVRKNYILDVGCLSEDSKLMAVEDFDLWIRISRTTERFKYINKPLGGYWVGSGNVSAQSLLKALDRRQELYKRYLDILEPKYRIKSEKRLNRELLGLHLNHAIRKEQSGSLGEAEKLVRKSLTTKNIVLKIKSLVVFSKIKMKIIFKVIQGTYQKNW